MSRLHKPKRNYTTISNNILNDNNVSWKAKGIYAYLVSKTDDYDFSVERVAKDTKDGERATYSAVNEIIDTGYMYREKLPSGKVDYHLFNNPAEKAEFLKVNGIEPILQNSKQAQIDPVLQNSSLLKTQTAKTAGITNTESKPSSSIKKDGDPEKLKTLEDFQLDEIRRDLWLMKGYTPEGLTRHTLNWQDYIRNLEEPPQNLSSSLDNYLSNRLSQFLKEEKSLKNVEKADELANQRIQEFHAKKQENIAKVGTQNNSKYPAKPKIFKPYYREYESREAYDQAILDARQNGMIVETDPLPNNAGAFWGEDTKPSYNSDLAEKFLIPKEPKEPDFEARRKELTLQAHSIKN